MQTTVFLSFEPEQEDGVGGGTTQSGFQGEREQQKKEIGET